MNYPFARVLVIGCPGSGKSTFARRLHELTALPLCHLDLLFWNADKTTCTKEEFSAKLEEVLQTEAWIMDGNYSRTMERRLQCADAVFFFDLPTETCLDGVRKRRHQPRPDMPWVETEEDAEFMEFIRTFAQLRKPEIQKILAGAPHVPVITFSSHKEADAYLEACRLLQEVTIPQRKPNRLPNYDYSSPGVYFLTLCTAQKRQCLWKNVGARIARPQEIELSEYGKATEEAIHNISSHYPRITVENYVIMPDHVHLLLRAIPSEDGRAMRAPTMGTVVCQLKGYITKKTGASIWQKLYYDHVVRNGKDYSEIFNYIYENPLRWCASKQPKGE